MSTVVMRVTGADADLKRLQDAARTALATARLDDPFASDVAVALDEVLSNVVRHGFRDGGPHEVRVSVVTSEEHVVVTVEDDGPPFDPLSFPPPDLDAPLETRAVGGLGIHLVRRLMDEVRYVREGGWNRLVLRRRRPSVAS